MNFDNASPNILVIRLGLLGDMMCTTPMLEAIKKHFPAGRLCLLSNEYNRPVVTRNPFVDRLYTYIHTKERQRNPRQGLLASLIDAWRLKHDLKNEHFGWVIICNAGFNKASVRIAQKLRPAKIISATREDGSYDYHVDYPIHGLLSEPIRHEVIRTFDLLAPLGMNQAELPKHLTLTPDPQILADFQRQFAPPAGQLIVAVHISARDRQREWPIENFAALMHAVEKNLPNARFWIIHAPNDNNRANQLKPMIEGIQHQFMVPTNTEQLIATLALSTVVVCQEGGILHLAAGLQKPVVGLFENTPEKVGAWFPWGVPHVSVKPGPGEPIAVIKTQSVIDGVLALFPT